MTEIPADIMKAAEGVTKTMPTSYGWRKITKEVALAILAERQRCFHVTNREWESCDYTDIFDGYQVAALRDAADRIMSGLHMHEFQERKRENV